MVGPSPEDTQPRTRSRSTSPPATAVNEGTRSRTRSRSRSPPATTEDARSRTRSRSRSPSLQWRHRQRVALRVRCWNLRATLKPRNKIEREPCVKPLSYICQLALCKHYSLLGRPINEVDDVVDSLQPHQLDQLVVIQNVLYKFHVNLTVRPLVHWMPTQTILVHFPITTIRSIEPAFRAASGITGRIEWHRHSATPLDVDVPLGDLGFKDWDSLCALPLDEHLEGSMIYWCGLYSPRAYEDDRIRFDYCDEELGESLGG